MLYIMYIFASVYKYNMGELKEYKCNILKGSIGNTEYWTEGDWIKHRKYVEELKESGEYLKEEEITISVMPDDLFDQDDFFVQNTKENQCMSYRFDIIDLGNKK